MGDRDGLVRIMGYWNESFSLCDENGAPHHQHFFFYFLFSFYINQVGETGSVVMNSTQMRSDFSWKSYYGLRCSEIDQGFSRLR